MTLPATACANHPDRRAGVSCQRCGRPICPDCMVTASVGFHCPQCARAGAQHVHTRSTLDRQRDPVVTKAVVGINVVAYVVVALSGGNLMRPAGDLFLDGALIGLGYVREGAGIVALGVDTGEWYRLVTGGFLHANLLHLGMNMYLLWLLGSVLEPAFGRLRFGLLYTVSLLAGSFGVMLLDPNQLTVGASGAVFGMMGAMLVAQRAAGMNVWQSGIGGLVVLNLVITFAIPNISIGGHVGGLVGGALAGALLVELPRRLPSGDRARAVAMGTGLVVALGVACTVGAVWAAGQWPSVL